MDLTTTVLLLSTSTQPQLPKPKPFPEPAQHHVTYVQPANKDHDVYEIKAPEHGLTPGIDPHARSADAYNRR